MTTSTPPTAARAAATTLAVLALAACGAPGGTAAPGAATSASPATTTTPAATTSTGATTGEGADSAFCAVVRDGSAQLGAQQTVEALAGGDPDHLRTYFETVHEYDARLQAVAPAAVADELAVLVDVADTMRGTLAAADYDVDAVDLPSMLVVLGSADYVAASQTYQQYLVTVCGVDLSTATATAG